MEGLFQLCKGFNVAVVTDVIPLGVNSWQKGGGAIFNTVKTKANPAMKTVYKLVSTLVEANPQQWRIEPPLTGTSCFTYRLKTTRRCASRKSRPNSSKGFVNRVAQSFTGDAASFWLGFKHERVHHDDFQWWQPLPLCPPLTGTVRKRLLSGSADRSGRWTPSRLDLLRRCRQGNRVAPISGWPQTHSHAPRTSNNCFILSTQILKFENSSLNTTKPWHII